MIQDMGNTNYSLMMPRAEFQRKVGVSMVCRALHQMDIPASVSERYDLCIGSSKISGSAYRITDKRAYHHGTMLIDSNLEQLKGYLRPKRVMHWLTQTDLSGGGIDSVRSQVTSLRNHSFTADHHTFCEAVVNEFSRLYGPLDMPCIHIADTVDPAYDLVGSERETLTVRLSHLENRLDIWTDSEILACYRLLR